MSLSDCPECWDTPCTCGAAYKSMSLEYKIRLAAAVLGISEAEMLVIWNRRAPDPRVQKLAGLLRESNPFLDYYDERLAQSGLPRRIDAALAEVGEG